MSLPPLSEEEYSLSSSSSLEEEEDDDDELLLLLLVLVLLVSEPLDDVRAELLLPLLRLALARPLLLEGEAGGVPCSSTCSTLWRSSWSVRAAKAPLLSWGAQGVLPARLGVDAHDGSAGESSRGATPTLPIGCGDTGSAAGCPAACSALHACAHR